MLPYKMKKKNKVCTILFHPPPPPPPPSFFFFFPPPPPPRPSSPPHPISAHPVPSCLRSKGLSFPRPKLYVLFSKFTHVFFFAPDSHPLRASQPPHSGPAAHHERCAEASDGRNCNAQKQARHTPTPTTHFTGLNPQSPSGTRLHATRPIASPTS